MRSWTNKYKPIFKKQAEILELKNTSNGLKNWKDSFVNRLDQSEEIIN